MSNPNQPKVIMYATGLCPYCMWARQLLEQKGVSWEEIRSPCAPRWKRSTSAWGG